MVPVRLMALGAPMRARGHGMSARVQGRATVDMRFLLAAGRRAPYVLAALLRNGLFGLSV